MSLRFRAMRVAITTAAACALAFTGLTAAEANPATPASGASSQGAAAGTPSTAPFMNYAIILAANTDAAVTLVKTDIANAGGTALSSYAATGTVFAQSNNPKFVELMKARPGVTMVGPTRTAPIEKHEQVAAAAMLDADGNVAEPSPQRPAGSSGLAPSTPLSAALTGKFASPTANGASEWDMAIIGADRAADINPGSPDVTVAVIDSGVEATHPNLAGRVDGSRSVGCQYNGIPDTSPMAWGPSLDPYTLQRASSHGTHVAGTIGAALVNGQGVQGVAPETTMISITAMNYHGLFYPEYVACAFDWAANHNVQVTNNSYYVDPWEFWCSDQENQAAGMEAVRRMVAYSHDKGVLNVAAAGNSALDLDAKTTDSGSPNDVDGAAIPNRPVANCLDLPTELPDVVSVASIGRKSAAVSTIDNLTKSSFSNYGSKVTVAAPGSQILSTVFDGKLGVSSGTSMASPHVAGVAALIEAAHPDITPARATELLRKQATPRTCAQIIAGLDATTAAQYTAECKDLTGSTTNYFGAGVVDAYAAVTEDGAVAPEPTEPKPSVFSVPTGPQLYVLSGTGASTKARVVTYDEWVAWGSPQPTRAPAEFVKYAWGNPIFMVNKWTSDPATWTWTHIDAAGYANAGYPAPQHATWIPGTTVIKYASSDDLIAGIADARHTLTLDEWKAMGYPAFRDLSPAGYLKLTWSPDVYSLPNVNGNQATRVTFAMWSAAGYPTPRAVQKFGDGQYLKAASGDDIYYVSAGAGINHKLTFSEWIAAGAPQPTGTVSR